MVSSAADAGEPLVIHWNGGTFVAIPLRRCAQPLHSTGQRARPAASDIRCRSAAGRIASLGPFLPSLLYPGGTVSEILERLESTTELWDGELPGEARRLQIHLDRAALHEGRAAGIAARIDGGASTMQVLEGSADSGRLRFRTTPPADRAEGDGWSFDGTRNGDTVRGELRDSAGRVTGEVTLRRLTPGGAAPPPPPRETDGGGGGAVEMERPDEPLDVHYVVRTNLGNFTLENFSIPLHIIPLGTWSGPSLWGTGSGWVHLNFDVVGWRWNPTLTSWNPFAEVANFYAPAAEVIFNKDVQLVASTAYPTDRWVTVTGTLTKREGRRG
jgi:hypothetical protein